MSNYTSDYKAHINKHIRDTYEWTDYSGVEPAQLKSKVYEQISLILNQTCPLPRQTYLWLPTYVKYVQDIGQWLIYDYPNGVWHLQGDDLSFSHFIDDLIQAIYDIASEYGDEGYKAYALHFITSPSKRNALKASLKGAHLLSIPSIKTLNNYKWRLFKDTSGGAVLMDMEANSLQDAIKQVKLKDVRPLMLQHKIATPLNVTDYNEPKTWLKVIDDCMMNDPEKVEWFKKVLAYMMSPNNYAQTFIWWLGAKGGNGKSTVFRTICNIIGDDQSIILRSNLLVKNKIVGYKKDDDLAKMNGRSLYIFNEFEDGLELATTSVKEITEGMGTIMVRPAYERNHMVEIIGTPVGVCNTLPPIRGYQNASPLFRRFAIVRFDRVFTDPDTSIMQKLEKEYADIHTWLYLNYFEHKGVNLVKEKMPADFADTIRNYRTDSDSINDFWSKCMEKADYDRVMRPKQIYDAYANFMTQYRGERPMPFGRAYQDAMKVYLDNLDRTTSNGGVVYHGIATNDLYRYEVMKGI